jgi:hypothetical protein
MDDENFNFLDPPLCIHDCPHGLYRDSALCFGKAKAACRRTARSIELAAACRQRAYERFECRYSTRPRQCRHDPPDRLTPSRFDPRSRASRIAFVSLFPCRFASIARRPSQHP